MRVASSDEGMSGGTVSMWVEKPMAGRASCGAVANTLLRASSTVIFTHMDTVPPFIPSSEDATRIYGRGSCDAKGIIAAQIAAAEQLRREGTNVGLLFLVGEERDSQGARRANLHSPGCRFLING